MFTNSEIAHDISNSIVKIDERIYVVCDGDYYKSDFYSETELLRDTNIFKAFRFILFFFCMSHSVTKSHARGMYRLFSFRSTMTF